MSTQELSAREIDRYRRHLLIPEVGLAGQTRLRDARVLCIGAGGLGSAVLPYLAAAGIGRLGIVDDDVVERSNLQRQILYNDADIGRRKVDVAAEYVARQTPHCAVDRYPIRLVPENARELFRVYDVVVDGSDSFATRYLVCDAAIAERKPVSFAAVYRFTAQVAFFSPDGKPCYRCLFPQPPTNAPTCADGGVLGAVVGIAGTMQASAVLVHVLKNTAWPESYNAPSPATSQATRTHDVSFAPRSDINSLSPAASKSAVLHTLDVLRNSFRDVSFTSDPDCPHCGSGSPLSQLGELPHAAPLSIATEAALDPVDLDTMLARGEILLDVREPHERAVGEIPGSMCIPSSQFLERMSELDSRTPYIVACRIGQRSREVFMHLERAGFLRIRHLEGGLLAYAAINAAVNVL